MEQTRNVDIEKRSKNVVQQVLSLWRRNVFLITKRVMQTVDKGKGDIVIGFLLATVGENNYSVNSSELTAICTCFEQFTMNCNVIYYIINAEIILN